MCGGYRGRAGAQRPLAKPADLAVSGRGDDGNAATFAEADCTSASGMRKSISRNEGRTRFGRRRNYSPAAGVKAEVSTKEGAGVWTRARKPARDGQSR
jgi:hypothetical protein